MKMKWRKRRKRITLLRFAYDGISGVKHPYILIGETSALRCFKKLHIYIFFLILSSDIWTRVNREGETLLMIMLLLVFTRI